MSLVLAGRIAQPITRLAHEGDLIERNSVETVSRARGSLEVVRLSSALRALIVGISYAEQLTAAAETRAADVASSLTDDIQRLRTLADMVAEAPKKDSPAGMPGGGIGGMDY